MRKVLDASGRESISLQDEIDILDLYLELEKLRFGKDFEYTIQVASTIDTYKIELPSMIIQPFIENAIKHGLLHKKGNKELTIHFELNEKLICTIIDNGVGRKRSEEIKKRLTEQHQSFATEATQKRIELLNQYANNNYIKMD
jgi:LytS/YehU family sensor histidine kinase